MEAPREDTGCLTTLENLFKNSVDYFVKLICDSQPDFGLARFLWKILIYNLI